MIQMHRKPQAPYSISRFKDKTLHKKTVVLGICAVAFVGMTGLAGYFGWQFFTLKNDPSQRQKANQATIDSVKNQVSSIFAVPTDEEPTVAKIEDKEKLQGQVFFDKAQNGDYVIIYEKSKLALLYREHDKKIINAGPVNLDASGATSQTTQEQTAQPAAQTSDTQKPIKEKR